MPDAFLGLLDHFGSSIVDLFFVPGKGGVSWVEFVQGYNKCSGRMSSSMSLNTLLRVFSVTVTKAGLSLNLEFESDDADCKISGFLLPIDVLLFLWLCWTMSCDCQNLKSSKTKANLCLPDVNHLVLSALTSSAEVGSSLNVWNYDISALEVQLPVGKFLTWVLHTLPSLPDCFAQFVHARIQSCVTQEVFSIFPIPYKSIKFTFSFLLCIIIIFSCYGLLFIQYNTPLDESLGHKF